MAAEKHALTARTTITCAAGSESVSTALAVLLDMAATLAAITTVAIAGTKSFMSCTPRFPLTLHHGWQR
jgi:hypothetical protein